MNKPLIDPITDDSVQAPRARRKMLIAISVWVAVCVGTVVLVLLFVPHAQGRHSASSPDSKAQVLKETGTCPRPTGFGICVQKCSGDDSCPGEQKCCSNGCGHVCMDPVPPTACCLAVTPKCISCSLGLSEENFCSKCQSGELQLEVCMQCPQPQEEAVPEPQPSAPLTGIPHLGVCPEASEQMGTCNEQCLSDANCENSQKCCSNGCGHECVAAQSPVCCEALTPSCHGCRYGVTAEQFCDLCTRFGLDDFACYKCKQPQVPSRLSLTRAVANVNAINFDCNDKSNPEDWPIDQRTFCCRNHHTGCAVVPQGTFEYCGGFVGLRCSHPGDICADMPSDQCDPLNGGADCIGVCVDTRRLCTGDHQCNFGSLCLPTLCEGNDCPHFCTRPVPRARVMASRSVFAAVQSETHQGHCPTATRVGVCANLCDSDDECLATEKCCSNSCGRQCSPALRYNCLSREVWSSEKRQWCCAYMGLGCEASQSECCQEMTPACRACAYKFTAGQFCRLCAKQELSDEGCSTCEQFAPQVGQCPLPQSVGSCEELCVDDGSCPDSQLCCSNGCGHVCVPPV